MVMSPQKHTQNTEEKEYYCCNSSQHGFYPTDPIAVEAFFFGLLLPLAAILATPTRERKKASTPMVWARLKPLPPRAF
jgi:hypothetical protein